VRVRIGTTTLMVSEATHEGLKAMPAAYQVYVENVDSTFRQALSNGATKLFEPADMPYLDRQAGVVDSSGNTWFISQRLVPEPYDG
jgi:PhnB protein